MIGLCLLGGHAFDHSASACHCASALICTQPPAAGTCGHSQCRQSAVSLWTLTLQQRVPVSAGCLLRDVDSEPEPPLKPACVSRVFRASRAGLCGRLLSLPSPVFNQQQEQRCLNGVLISKSSRSPQRLLLLYMDTDFCLSFPADDEGTPVQEMSHLGV